MDCLTRLNLSRERRISPGPFIYESTHWVVDFAFLLSILVLGRITAFATVPRGPQSNHPSRCNQPSLSQGPPAITPSIHGTPAFTVENVRLYYQSHPFSAGPTVSGIPPTIKSVTFMTSHEFEVLRGTFIGLPDSAMVCVVE